MNKHWNRILCLVLILLFSFSLMTLIVACLGCSIQPAFYLWIALLCLSTWYTTCVRNGMWIGLPVSALLLFAASRFFASDLSQQLRDVLDLLTGAYVEQVVYPGDSYAYLGAASDHSLLLLFLSFLLASYMGAAISSRSGRIGLALLGSVPFFATCLAVTVKPPVLSVFGMLLFWFLLAVGGSHYDENASGYRRALAAVLPITLLLSLLLVIVNPEGYNYQPQNPDINLKLDNWFQSFDDWLNGLSGGERLSDPDAVPPSAEIEDSQAESIPERPLIPWQDQQGGMDLTHSLDRSELEKTFLQVKAGQSGSLYLRAVSYGDYTGTGWTQAEEASPLSSLSFTALALAETGSEERRLTIRLLQESAYRYLPYFCAEEDGFDSFVPSGLQSSYSSEYQSFPRSFDALRIPAAKEAAELAYRSYAYDYYTRLPVSTYTALQTLCEENGLYAGMDQLISQVAAFVQRTGRYDLDTDAYPSDDYAVYFLTSAKQGYCVHFATAAAALYRYLGVPARIVEGFLVDAEARRYTVVRGLNAHAWVEVYQDNLGWLPVEVTGQSGLDTDALGANDTPPNSESPSEASTANSAPADSSQEEGLPLPVGPLSQSQEEAAASQSRAVRKALYTVLLLILLLAIIPVRRIVLLALRNRRYDQDDTRKAVIAMYQTAQKASVFGTEPPDLLVRAAERAAFSQHDTSPDEVECCRDQLYIMLKSSYLRQNALGKFRFKYLCALL